jgi:hypothetical protein
MSPERFVKGESERTDGPPWRDSHAYEHLLDAYPGS